MREHYLEQLKQLRDQLLKLGSTVEDALVQAIVALETRDTTLAESIVRNDAHIDALQHALEELSIRVQATQQPVASDLRLTAAVIAIASELERIGDYASGIAKRVLRASAQSAAVAPPPDLLAMATLAQNMLRTSLEAFLRQDSDLAHSLSRDEERVDQLEKRVRAALIAMAQAEPRCIEAVVDLLDIVHNLERLADRTTNIGERVIFLATSATEALNP